MSRLLVLTREKRPVFLCSEENEWSRKGDLLLLLWTYMQQNKRVWYFNRISLGNYVFRHFKDSVLNKLNKVHHLTTRKVLKNQQKYEKRKYLLVFLLFWFLDKNLIVSFKNQKGYLSTNKKCNGSLNFWKDLAGVHSDWPLWPYVSLELLKGLTKKS